MSRLVTFSELHSYSSQQIRHHFGGKALGLYEAYTVRIPIPCIVGTGMGSTILSNGTKVRIDFDRAEIWIVENALSEPQDRV